MLRLEPKPAVYKPRCKNSVNPQIGFLEVYLCFDILLGCLFEVGVYMHGNIFIWDWMSMFFPLFHAWYTLAFMRIPHLLGLCMQNYRNVFQTSILSKSSFFQHFFVSPFQSSPFCLLPCFLHFPNVFNPTYASFYFVSIMHQEYKLVLQEC